MNTQYLQIAISLIIFAGITACWLHDRRAFKRQLRSHRALESQSSATILRHNQRANKLDLRITELCRQLVTEQEGRQRDQRDQSTDKMVIADLRHQLLKLSNYNNMQIQAVRDMCWIAFVFNDHNFTLGDIVNKAKALAKIMHIHDLNGANVWVHEAKHAAERARMSGAPELFDEDSPSYVGMSHAHKARVAGFNEAADRVLNKGLVGNLFGGTEQSNGRDMPLAHSEQALAIGRAIHHAQQPTTEVITIMPHHLSLADVTVVSDIVADYMQDSGVWPNRVRWAINVSHAVSNLEKEEPITDDEVRRVMDAMECDGLGNNTVEGHEFTGIIRTPVNVRLEVTAQMVKLLPDILEVTTLLTTTRFVLQIAEKPELSCTIGDRTINVERCAEGLLTVDYLVNMVLTNLIDQGTVAADDIGDFDLEERNDIMAEVLTRQWMEAQYEDEAKHPELYPDKGEES